jgi:hypothetical protein
MVIPFPREYRNREADEKVNYFLTYMVPYLTDEEMSEFFRAADHDEWANNYLPVVEWRRKKRLHQLARKEKRHLA